MIPAGTHLDKGSIIDLTVGIGSKGHGETKDTVAVHDSI